jgi:hypothetical protein
VQLCSLRRYEGVEFLNLDQDLDSYEQIRRWENAKRGVETYNLPKEIRPCISQLLVTKTEEGVGLGRSKTGLYIAVELRKYDIPEDKIEKVLKHWNRNNNIPPMADKEIRGILKQSSKKNTKGDFKYSPGCNNSYLVCFCIGKNDCNYYQKNFKGRGSTEPNYLAMGWQYVLTSREREILFYVLPKIERNRKLTKGSPIVITVKQLSYYTGIYSNKFKEILTCLDNYGLIKYKPGSSQLWKHQATEIRRIIPPPEIPMRYRENEDWVGYKKAMKRRKKEQKSKIPNSNK